MYLILIINQNLIACDHENNLKKLSQNTNKLSKTYFKTILCHFTIIVLIDIKFSSCYASEFIPYTYLNYNYVFCMYVTTY